MTDNRLQSRVINRWKLKLPLNSRTEKLFGVICQSIDAGGGIDKIKTCDLHTFIIPGEFLVSLEFSSQTEQNTNKRDLSKYEMINSY